MVAPVLRPAAKIAMGQQDHPPAILGHPASQAGWLSRNGSSEGEEQQHKELSVLGSAPEDLQSVGSPWEGGTQRKTLYNHP